MQLEGQIMTSDVEIPHCFEPKVRKETPIIRESGCEKPIFPKNFFNKDILRISADSNTNGLSINTIGQRLTSTLPKWMRVMVE